MGGHREKVAILMGKERPQKKLTLLTPSSWTSRVKKENSVVRTIQSMVPGDGSPSGPTQ